MKKLEISEKDFNALKKEITAEEFIEAIDAYFTKEWEEIKNENVRITYSILMDINKK